MPETALATLIPLREILTESISAVKEREASALDQLLLAHQNRVVLFGCGTLGRRAADLLREIEINPLAFCDSNPSHWGTNVSGLPVLSAFRCSGAVWEEFCLFRYYLERLSLV